MVIQLAEDGEQAIGSNRGHVVAFQSSLQKTTPAGCDASPAFVKT